MSASNAVLRPHRPMRRPPLLPDGADQPIDAPLYPAQAFDADRLLSEALRDLVADIAYRQCCPVDYAAVRAVAIPSHMIMRSRGQE
jgi:hypothetical protein